MSCQNAVVMKVGQKSEMLSSTVPLGDLCGFERTFRYESLEEGWHVFLDIPHIILFPAFNHIDEDVGNVPR